MIRTDASRTRVLLGLAAATLLALALGAGGAAAAPGNADGAPADGGTPSDLPGPVPDFVGDVLGTVNDFVSGGAESLGETVSDLTPGESSDAGG